MSEKYTCPECGAVMTVDLAGGGRANFGGAYCSGREDDPHVAVEMELEEDE